MSVKLVEDDAMTATPPAPPPPQEVLRLIRGRWVERVGEFASMTREEFQELVEAHGGQVASGRLGAGVGLLVVGQKDWLISRDGLPFPLLRRARVATLREGRSLVVLSE